MPLDFSKNTNKEKTRTENRTTRLKIVVYHLLNGVHQLISQKGILNSMPSKLDHLFDVLREGNITQAKKIIKEFPNILHEKNKYGWISLHVASTKRHLGIIQFMIDQGADINAQTERLETPVFVATCYGCIKVVRLLIENGSNVTIKDMLGHTAYDKTHNKEMRYLLRKALESAKCVSASARGDIGTVKRLLQDAPYVIDGTNHGRTPLMAASAAGQVDVVRLLLERGADVCIKNKKGRNALSLSVVDEISEMLRDPSRRKLDVCRLLILEVRLRISQVASDREAAMSSMLDIQALRNEFPYISRCVPEDIVPMLQNSDVDTSVLISRTQSIVHAYICEIQNNIDLCLQCRDVAGVRQWDAMLKTVVALSDELSSASHPTSASPSTGTCVIDRSDVSVDDSACISNTAYAQVYRGTFRGTDVAIKMIRGHGDMVVDRDLQQSEILLLSSLRHPRIVTLMGVILEFEPRYGGAMYGLVTEFMTRGSLYSVLHNSNTPFAFRLTSLATKLRVLADVAEGMKFLHRSNVIHRDLKSMNVLLDEEGRAKICDFGMSKILSADTTHTSTAGMGTPAWSSPEALYGNPGGVRLSTDVYSFGVILWEMLTNAIPWHGVPAMQLPVLISHGESLPIPNASANDAPQALIDLLSSCLDRIPHNRPSFEYLVDSLKDLKKGCRGPCPPEYICPISYEVMEDPVLCSDGQTYDRVNIERWLRDHNTSPMSNLVLQDASLRPNIVLRRLIQAFLQSDGF